MNDRITARPPGVADTATCRGNAHDLPAAGCSESGRAGHAHWRRPGPAPPERGTCAWWSLAALLLVTCCGCLEPGDSAGELELVWGEHGSSAGRFQKPR